MVSLDRNQLHEVDVHEIIGVPTRSPREGAAISESSRRKQ